MLKFDSVKLNEISKSPSPVREISAKDIAIIGMAVNLPKAETLMDYWRNIQNGVDCITEFPESRRADTDLFLHRHKPGAAIKYNRGAYLPEIDKFDPAFFQLSPKEASLMSPCQRLFLETAWHALEDAGYGGRKLSGSRTGVFLGFEADAPYDYKRFIAELEPASLSFAVPGNLTPIIASRLSYILDLHGLSISVDTACSSALVAVHLACQAIRNGECDLVLVGSVRLNLLPVEGQFQLGVESSDGRTHAFDENSDGTGSGEGVAAILLKPLSRAIKDGDQVYAVIKGSAANQDGSSIGITAPNVLAQEDVIVKAWKDAGIDPETITYIEAHGTGTRLGDPIEIDGIRRAFSRFTDKKQFCAIGSVKTNLGHLDNAAGIVGLIKAVLALQAGKIPPSLHFHKPNWQIPFEQSPVYLNDRLRDWETDGAPRRCGISSFGFSGTNCHIILEEAPAHETVSPSPATRLNVLTLTAKSAAALRDLLTSYLEFMRRQVAQGKPLNMTDICYTANTGRGQYNFRLAVICEDPQDFIEKAAPLCASGFKTRQEQQVYYGEHRLVPDTKSNRESGELTAKEYKKLCAQAAETIKKFLRGGKTAADILAVICDLFVKGAAIDWEEIYAGIPKRKVSLPVYPFERKRCWIEPERSQTAVESTKNNGLPAVGALQQRCVLESMDFEVYSSYLDPQKCWILDEHRVMGQAVLVGTAYLEMVAEALQRHHAGARFIFKDIIFIAPFIVTDGTAHELQIIVKKMNDWYEFSAVSKSRANDNGAPSWTKHIEGKIGRLDTELHTNFSVAELKAKQQNKAVTPDLEDYNRRTAFQLGPHWKNIRQMYAAADELLSYIELPAEFAAELNDYIIHPSLLDNALTTIPLLQQVIGFQPENPDNIIFLPFSYQAIRMQRPIPGKFYSLVKLKEPVQPNPDMVTFDIRLLDLQGDVFIEIDGYSLKRVYADQLLKTTDRDELYYQLRWIPQKSSGIMPPPDHATVLLLNDETGLGKALRAKLNGMGLAVIMVERGPSYQKIDGDRYLIGDSQLDYDTLGAELQGRNVTHIVHLRSVTGGTVSRSLADLAGSQLLGAKSLFYLTKTLYHNRFQKLVLILVSEYIHEIDGSERVIIPENATLFGLGKAISQEFPGWQCKFIDIDPAVEATDLVAELFTQGDSQVAYRNGIRYLPELHRLDLARLPACEPDLKSEGVYLITGGAGGIGLEIAKYLASRQKINLALAGRSPMPPPEQWDELLRHNSRSKLAAAIRAIREIRAHGASVGYYQADVTSLEAMRKLLGELRSKFGRIQGIIHSAGLPGDGFIIHKDERTFDAVLAPKLQGTWILDHLTQNEPLDFLILFSSVVTLTGSPGQGDYTAANAYLDSFAAYRSKRGSRTLTVNWAGWQETGMAFDHGVNYDGLFTVLTNARAIQAFAEVFNKNITQVSIGTINYHHELLDKVIAGSGLKLAADLHAKLQRERNLNKQSRRHSAAKLPEVRLTGKPEAEYTGLERQIAAVWGEILGYEELNVYDNFYQLGGDSISMMQIISRLGEQQIAISFRDFVEQNNIADLAAFIARQTSAPEAPRLKLDFPQPKPDVANLTVPFPLTTVQTAYLFGRDEHVELGGVSTHAYLEVETKLELERFNRSLQKVIWRHPMLRAVILPGGLQQILPEVPEYQMEILDLRACSPEAQNARILEERQRMSHFVFSGEQWPLFEFKAFRLTDETNYLFIGIDVIIADAFSLQLIFKEILDYYEDPDLQLPAIDFSFRDYMLAYQEFKTSEAYALSKRYWLDRLPEFPAAPALPLKQDPSQISRPRFRRLRKVYPKPEWERLKQTAQQKSITPSALLCTAYAQVLAYWSNQPRLAINLTVFNRYPFHPDIYKLVGDFTSVVLLGLDLEPYHTFWDMARYVQGVLMEALEHRHYDGVEFIREIALYHNLGMKAIMPVVFTSMFFENPVESREPGRVVLGLTQTPQVYIDHQVTEQNGALIVQWDYVEDLFFEDRITAIFEHYTGLIAGLLRNEELALHPPAADLELYEQYNHTRTEIIPAALHQLVVEQVNRTPENKAVIYDEAYITYLELHEKSNQVAHYLAACGIKRGDRVGVVAYRVPETIINLLGILKSGAAYVPLEPDYPEERRNYIISHSECRLILGPELFQSKDLARFPVENPPAGYHPDDLAYVIYTSGSTGRPKGVMITHRAAANTISDINQKFKLGENDRIMGISSLCFDLSVYDVFGSLSTGAALVLVPDQRDIPGLIKTVERQGITVWNSVPAIMGLAVENLPENYEQQSLRLVMLSGDWIPLPLPPKIKRHYPRAAVISLGGATEASIWSIYHPIEAISPDWKSIPYGRPLANQSFYTLDYRQRLLPVGVPGELYIGGAGLAAGYCNDPEKTEYSFIQHPALGNLYRTGDYGVLHPEGYLEFLGRKDNQIKIRGFRIELGDIESCLLKHPLVKNAVVIDREGQNHQKYLCAYVVCGEEPDKTSLREFLADFLPAYMIPSYFVRLDKIPLTSNGKVDRKALPEPDKNVNTANTYSAPRNEVETALARIWQDILKLDRVGIHDNFFELGGSSVQLMAVHSRIEKLFPGKAKITDLFIHPNIAKLAVLLERDAESPKIELPALKLPGEFFNPENGIADYQILRFRLDAGWSQKIKHFAVGRKVEVDKVLLMIYGYLLAQVSGQTELTIQIMVDRPGTAVSFTLNINEINDFQDFIRYYRGRAGQNQYSIQEIARINIRKAQHTILPFFYTREFLTSKVDLLRYFDLVFEIEAGGDTVNFVCEYDAQCLQSHKINELINNYLKLIKYTITELKHEAMV